MDEGKCQGSLELLHIRVEGPVSKFIQGVTHQDDIHTYIFILVLAGVGRLSGSAQYFPRREACRSGSAQAPSPAHSLSNVQG